MLIEHERTKQQGRRQGKSLGGRRNLGGPAGRAPGGGLGGSLFSAKIVIEALPEHVFTR